jgi:hypothetical protein
MIVGCYDLHLYCDGIGCENGPFSERAQLEGTHEFGASARRAARKRGWRLLRSGHCLCPKCVASGATIDPEAS